MVRLRLHCSIVNKNKALLRNLVFKLYPPSPYFLKANPALPLLKSLPEELLVKGEVKLALAACYLETQDFTLAAEQLQHIPLEYQDNDYKSLIAKLELHNQAANSPEIQSLESAFAQDQDNAKLALDLALNYHLIWRFIVKNLNALDGEMKKTFMDILQN